MGIKLSSPDLDQQNAGDSLSNGIESLIRIEVDSSSFTLNNSNSNLANLQQQNGREGLKPAKHQRSQSVGRFILTSMITSNNTSDVKSEDPVFDALKNTKSSEVSKVPTLNLTNVEQLSAINSDRKSKSLSTSLLNIGSSSSAMKTPRATQFNIYSKLISGISHQEHLKRLQDCKLVLILGGVDSGKSKCQFNFEF